ncbi:MAG: GP88 family protein [Paraclostridium sp.]
MQLNLMTLGMTQKMVVKAPKTKEVITVCNVETSSNRRIYELAMDTFDTQIREGKKIQDNQILNNYTLANYTFKMSNDRLYIVDKNDDKLIYGSMAFGNAKLKATNKEMYVQFNLGQKVTCPIMGTTCNNCYADKAFNVLINKNGDITNNGISRLTNTILSQFANFENIISEALNYIKSNTNKKVILRFHESGDIYSPLYWGKMKNIMLNNKDIDFMIYTRVPHVVKEIKQLNAIDNIMIRFSVDKSTPNGLLKYIIDNGINTFIAIDKKDEGTMEIIQEYYNKGLICNVANPNGTKNKELLANSKDLHCLKCGKCRSKKIIPMYVVIH